MIVSVVSALAVVADLRQSWPIIAVSESISAAITCRVDILVAVVFFVAVTKAKADHWVLFAAAFVLV